MFLMALFIFSSCGNKSREDGFHKIQEGNTVFIGHFMAGEKQGLGMRYVKEGLEMVRTYNTYLQGKKAGVELAHKIYKDHGGEQVLTLYKSGTPIYPILKINYGKQRDLLVKYKEDTNWLSITKELANGSSQVKIVPAGDDHAAIETYNDEGIVLKLVLGSKGLLVPFMELPKDPSLSTRIFVNSNKDVEMTLKNTKDPTIDSTINVSIDWTPNPDNQGSLEYKKYRAGELQYQVNQEQLSAFKKS